MSNAGSSTDWQDVIFRRSTSHNQNLSYSKSHDSGSYIATLGFGNQYGIVENSNLERLTARLNLNQRFLDDKLRLTFNGAISRVHLLFLKEIYCHLKPLIGLIKNIFYLL